jgi:hypothetical protein
VFLYIYIYIYIYRERERERERESEVMRVLVGQTEGTMGKWERENNAKRG